MNLKQRFLRYLIGIFIGLLMVVFFFGDRDWLGWTPERKILGHLTLTYQPLSENMSCLLECYNIPEDAIDSTLIHGDVRLRESETHEEPRLYVVKSPDGYPRFRATFSSGETEAHLVKIKLDKPIECNCE